MCNKGQIQRKFTKPNHLQKQMTISHLQLFYSWVLAVFYQSSSKYVIERRSDKALLLQRPTNDFDRLSSRKHQVDIRMLNYYNPSNLATTFY